jgi:predicted RNase H-like HicB family nuclease
VSAPSADSDAVHDLAYYEAVPYLLVIESVQRGNEWLRRAEHPELPGCSVEAPSAVEAMDKLEQARLSLLRQLWDRGAPIPVPRPPLARR